MALVVEDGTGKATAESYISVADADQYHLDRGNAAWSALASSTIKEQALRRATDYMVQVYRSRWLGMRATAVQALDWPRYDVPIPDAPSAYGSATTTYAPNVVPIAVIRACAELALKASAADLTPDLDRPTTSETVGEISVTYEAGSRQFIKFREIDNILGMLLSGGWGVQVVRA